MVTNQRVAIKEYYPTYCAVRSDARTVTFYRGQEEVYHKGRDRFLDEARVLKSLSDIKSIVNVLDFFEANNTAYLVMEFLEGDSLKAHAQKHGKFPAQEFLRKLRPLMEDIDQMHQRGVVHRDIAPDNIILTPDGQMKLIDFGAARSYVGDKSMTVVVKKGFAPIEQYMRHGSTTATDVYALAATIYYCTTGTVPPDSAERQYEEDKLKSPTSLGAELSKEQERALLKALEVQPQKRTQTVAGLMKALEHSAKPEKLKSVKKTEKPKAEPRKKPKWMIPAVAAVLICVIGAVLFMGKQTPKTYVQMESEQTAATENEPVEIVPADVRNVLAEPEHGVRGADKTFWGQSVYIRKEVITVSFVYTLKDALADAVDVSEAKDGSILAWMTDGHLTVASNGHIALNPNSFGMFADFRNMEHVDFGNYLDTSLVENMSMMFRGCSSLQELDLTSFDTSKVTNMYSMFNDCSNLQELDVSEFDTSKVTDMSSMFNNCNKLQELDLSDFDTSKSTSMRRMFYGCNNLQELDLSSFNTSQVKSMASMFAYCSVLSDLDVSSFDTKKVADMSQMFYRCRNLKILDLNHFKYSSISKMNYMFGDCTGMEKLYLKGFVRNEKGVSDGGMFDNCPAKIIK